MRVLEWLDADCGTRLARHYQQAGGWRSLPQRQQRACHQPPAQRQPLGLTGSSVVYGTDVFQGYVKDSEDDSSTCEDETRILEEEEEDELLNDEDADDDDDLVLALRKWQEEQLLQQEHYEDLSMQDYVTSSEDDTNEDDSDSEDELVLALKTWQEEQLRQEKIQQQYQHHRQIPLAQQPPALTPVIEDQVSSPSHDGFGYFYQDKNCVVYHYNKQQTNKQHQPPGATPYWWGDISSVREGPSSPPVLVKHSEPGKSSSAPVTSNQGNRSTLAKARSGNDGGTILVNTHCDNNVKLGNANPAQGPLTLPQQLATTVTTTALTLPTPAQTPRSTSHHSSLLLPQSSSQISPASSPRLETPSWSFGSRVKTPILSKSPSIGTTLGASPATVDNVSTKVSNSACGNKLSAIDAGKENSPLYTPHFPQVNKTSTAGSPGFSNWPSSASYDKSNPTFLYHADKDVTKLGENDTRLDAQIKTCSSSQSTASSDSGIERSPVCVPTPAKPVGIDRIGYFFRKFQNKLSTSSSPSSPSKTTSSQPSEKKQFPKQQQQKSKGSNSRRLSLSTPSIPSTTSLKPATPVAKFAAVHPPCLATISDPLASSVLAKRLRNQWLGGHKSRKTIGQEDFDVGSRSSPAGCPVSHVSLDSNSCVISGGISASSAGTGSGTLGTTVADSRPASSAVVLSSKGALTIDTSTASGAFDNRRGPTTPTFGVGSIGKVVAGGGKEVQPFFVPQSYQQSHQHLGYHQADLQSSSLVRDRSAGEINRKICRQHFQNGVTSDSANQSGTRYFSQNSLDTQKIVPDVSDNCGAESDKPGALNLVSASAFLGWNGRSRGATQILNKSPGSETEQKIHCDSVERDPQGKIRTLFSSGSITVNGSSSVSGSSSVVCSNNNVNGSSNVNFVSSATSRAGEECSNISVNLLTDSKRREGKSKEDLVNSKSTERSSSTSSDERGTLTVPDSGYDRNRRGSHGSCNHLFREPAGGRKSPLIAKGSKTPSPVRGGQLKGVVGSAPDSSSSFSAESPSKQPHPAVGRVVASSSPSSPPSHVLQSKSSPKFILTKNGSESNTTKIIPTDSPPANYRSRRKFSDTGLTPVPRRLFSDGRRGSLTDEKTLVFAKSKLGKLRSQDRKLSDASSVAALVKQIHNLWGEGEEAADEDNKQGRETIGLTCSFDDQVLFEKRRKQITLSVSKDKEIGKDGSSVGEDRKSVNKISGASSGDIDKNSVGDEGFVSNPTADIKRKSKAADRSAFLPVASLNSRPISPSVTLASVTAGAADVEACDKSLEDSVKDNCAIGIPAADCSNGGASSGGGLNGSSVTCLSGSEFVAPLAQVASRQLVAAAVSSVAFLVGIDKPDNLITRGPVGLSTAYLHNSTGTYPKAGKKTATVQFQPIVSRDDNVVGGKVSPAVRSVLKQGTRRHSSFAGFSDSNDDIHALHPASSDNVSSPLIKSAKNGLPKSKTSDNYKSILKPREKLTLSDIDSTTTTAAAATTTTATSTSGDKKRAKSPSPKSKKGFDYSPDSKNPELSLSLCLKASRSLSPRLKKYRTETKDLQDSTDQSSQATPFSSTDREQFTDSGNCSLDLPTKTIGVQATPRTIGKTSNAGTQTSDLSAGGDSSTDQSSSPPENSGWLQRLAAKCMASVGGSNRPGPVGGAPAGLPRAASVRAEWLLGNKRMGSNPSSPVAAGGDASEKFWVPHGLIARKRAQSLVPSLSKQDSEDDLSSEAATPASIPHPRDLAFNFVNEKAGTSGGSSDGQPPTPPPSAYNPGRRRASMHDAIDLTKIDTRLYDKKLVRQASVMSIEEESQGTVHVSLEHNSETGILTVNLIRAHNLLPRDLHYTANPYCRITVLPGQRSSAQSRIHRKTLNPEFEEEFIFELPTEEVSRSILEVSFYEYDQFSKDECVGYVRIPLNEIDLSKQVDLWRSISPYDRPKDQRDLGDVMFSLSYLPSAERLTVVIVRARNLRPLDDSKADLNPFIKVCITAGSKKLKKKKTSTAHSTNSPIWNEALVFSVHRESLKNIGLEVSAYHDNKLGIDECIGRIRLPANSQDGIHCQELLKEKSMPARWYNLT